MTLSTIEWTPAQRSVCPHCGRPLEQTQPHSWIQTGLGILALAALALMLAPLGIMAWKACTNLLPDRESHSILFHPLEDWTRY
jgi:uncharacterized paraquat-inducible protein A